LMLTALVRLRSDHLLGQHVGIRTAWRIGPAPSQIVSGGPKGCNGIAGEILVREKAHRQPALAGVSG